eukprot:1137194-Pelagomonas_calceolata.AAC.5
MLGRRRKERKGKERTWETALNTEVPQASGLVPAHHTHTARLGHKLGPPSWLFLSANRSGWGCGTHAAQPVRRE